MINNTYKNIRINTQEFIKYVNIFAMCKKHAHFKHTACFTAKLWPSLIKANTTAVQRTYPTSIWVCQTNPEDKEANVN